jgi:hypothetical protein
MANPQWISVKDRLPGETPGGDWIIGHDKYEGVFPTKFNPTDSILGGYWEILTRIDYDGDYDWASSVTHWQPRPELPEVDDE